MISAGVVIAGLIIMITDWDWLDPVVSLIIVVVIFVGSWGLLVSAVNMALDAVPEGIDPTLVERFLLALPGVEAIHDLHIWNMSTTEAAMTVHLVVAEGTANNDVLERASAGLHDEFGIEHATLQLETGDAVFECRVVTQNTV